MSESTKRAIRTFVQAVLGVAAAVAVAVPLMPPGTGRYAAVVAGAAVVAATIAKIWNALEDAGILPPWLRTDGAEKVRLSEAAYAEAWNAGHTAATVERTGTTRGAGDVTMMRPVIDSRSAMLDQDEPGKHSPDRGGRVPTTERAKPVPGRPAAAAAPVPDRPRAEWPNIIPGAPVPLDGTREFRPDER